MNVKIMGVDSVNMEIDMNALNIMDTICPNAKKYMLSCVDMGMGFLLRSAGGGVDWKVPDIVIHGSATIIVGLAENSLRKLEDNGLDENEKRAIKNLVKMVWYENIR